MHACRCLIVVVLVPVWLAACASAPPKQPGIFDLSNGLDRPSSSVDAGREQPGAFSPPSPGSVGSSIGAPTPGHLGAGIGD